jgi:hypothetical protein
LNGLFEGGFQNEWQQFDHLGAKLRLRKEGQYEPKQRIFISLDNLVMVFALFGCLMGGALILFVGEILHWDRRDLFAGYFL